MPNLGTLKVMHCSGWHGSAKSENQGKSSWSWPDDLYVRWRLGCRLGWPLLTAASAASCSAPLTGDGHWLDVQGKGIWASWPVGFAHHLIGLRMRNYMLGRRSIFYRHLMFGIYISRWTRKLYRWYNCIWGMHCIDMEIKGPKRETLFHFIKGWEFHPWSWSAANTELRPVSERWHVNRSSSSSSAVSMASIVLISCKRSTR